MPGFASCNANNVVFAVRTSRLHHRFFAFGFAFGFTSKPTDVLGSPAVARCSTRRRVS